MQPISRKWVKTSHVVKGYTLNWKKKIIQGLFSKQFVAKRKSTLSPKGLESLFCLLLLKLTIVSFGMLLFKLHGWCTVITN